jgi:transketolase
VACEAGIRQGWDKYIGMDGHFVGMFGFGASAPFGELFEHFKITSDQIVSLAEIAAHGLEN